MSSLVRTEAGAHPARAGTFLCGRGQVTRAGTGLLSPTASNAPDWNETHPSAWNVPGRSPYPGAGPFPCLTPLLVPAQAPGSRGPTSSPAHFCFERAYCTRAPPTWSTPDPPPVDSHLRAVDAGVIRSLRAMAIRTGPLAAPVVRDPRVPRQAPRPGASCACGDISARPGAGDAFGDGIAVTDGVECPWPEQDAPGRVDCPRHRADATAPERLAPRRNCESLPPVRRIA